MSTTERKTFSEEEKRERKNARQREYEIKTKYSAQAKYDKNNTKRYVIKVMFKTELDIIDRLEQESNKAGYIKRLIREDIKKS